MTTPSDTTATPPREVTIAIPESCQAVLKTVCSTKRIPPEVAAATMVYFACRLLEEAPLNAKSDLLTELDFARGLRMNTEQRADQLLGLVERVLLDSQGVHRAVRNRVLTGAKK